MDLSRLPRGGYGVIIPPRARDVLEDLRVALGGNPRVTGLLIDDETNSLTIENPLSWDDMVDRYTNSDLCLKLFYACDETACVLEDRVIAQLRQVLTEQEFAQYTTFGVIDHMYMLRIDMDAPATLDVSIRKTPMQRLFMIPQRWCEADFVTRKITRTNMSELIAALDFFHSKGVFHNDIKTDNIMVCGGRATFIDLGASIIDTDVTMDLRARYVAKNIVYPIAHAYFGVQHMRGESTLSRELMMVLGSHLKKTKLLQRMVSDLMFQRYMFHKNDCFMLAQLIWGFLQRGEGRGGGILSCFRPKVSDDNAADTTKPDAEIRELRNKIDALLPIAPQLLYCDVADFESFKSRYKVCPPIEATGTGGMTHRFNFKGRSYVVRRGSRGGRYILVKGKKIYV
jgi:hypothetical protein